MDVDKLLSALKALPKDTILYNSGSGARWIKGEKSQVVLSMVPVPTQSVKQMIFDLESLLNVHLSNDIAFRRLVRPGEALYMDKVVDYHGRKIIVSELVTDDSVKLWQCVPTDSTNVVVAMNNYVSKEGIGLVKVVEDYWNALNMQGKLEYLNLLTRVKAFKYLDKEGKEITFNDEYWGKSTCPCPEEKDKIEKMLNGFVY